MLPKLTEKRSVKFVPTEIEPAFVTARRNALLELKSLDAIRISYSGKGSSYTIELFADSSHSRLTTNTTSTTSCASTDAPTTHDGACVRRPTVRIQRALGEFIDLRDKVYNSMFQAHYKGYCKFCAGVLVVVVEGVDPGGVFFTLLGQGRAVRKLTQFTEDLLGRTVEHASADVRSCCSAQILVPQIVHAFLFTPQLTTTSEAA